MKLPAVTKLHSQRPAPDSVPILTHSLSDKYINIMPSPFHISQDSIVSKYNDSLWAGWSRDQILVRWQDFLHPSRLALVLTQLPVQWVLGLCPRGLSGQVMAITTNPHTVQKLKKE